MMNRVGKVWSPVFVPEDDPERFEAAIVPCIAVLPLPSISKNMSVPECLVIPKLVLLVVPIIFLPNLQSVPAAAPIYI